MYALPRTVHSRYIYLDHHIIIMATSYKHSETAEISLEDRDIALHRTPLLREYHKGAFEGLTNQQIQKRFPAQYPTYLTKDLDFAPDGGESTRAVSVLGLKTT